MDVSNTADVGPTSDDLSATSEAPASIDAQPASHTYDAGASAPSPAASPIDYQALAHAVAAANRPPPTPQKQAWDDPNYYKLAVPDEKLHEELHGRFSQHARGVVQSEIQNFAPAVRQYVESEIARARDEMRAMFAMDPSFAKAEPHYKALTAKGLPAAEARELANFRAGIGRASSGAGQQPATAPRVPQAPAHAAATTPGRPAAPAPVGRNGLPAWNDVHNKKERQSRWNALADNLGFAD
jgi:hypothetical protein